MARLESHAVDPPILVSLGSCRSETEDYRPSSTSSLAMRATNGGLDTPFDVMTKTPVGVEPT